jgi:hypothetical protein
VRLIERATESDQPSFTKGILPNLPFVETMPCKNRETPWRKKMKEVQVQARTPFSAILVATSLNVDFGKKCGSCPDACARSHSPQKRHAQGSPRQ